MSVVGEAGDGLAAIDRLRHLPPDIVVMDITMPNLLDTSSGKGLP